VNIKYHDWIFLKNVTPRRRRKRRRTTTTTTTTWI